MSAPRHGQPLYLANGDHVVVDKVWYVVNAGEGLWRVTYVAEGKRRGCVAHWRGNHFKEQPKDPPAAPPAEEPWA